MPLFLKNPHLPAVAAILAHLLTIVFCFFLSVSLCVFFFSVYVVCFMCIYGPQLSEINE